MLGTAGGGRATCLSGRDPTYPFDPLHVTALSISVDQGGFNSQRARSGPSDCSALPDCCVPWGRRRSEHERQIGLPRPITRPNADRGGMDLDRDASDNELDVIGRVPMPESQHLMARSVVASFTPDATVGVTEGISFTELGLQDGPGARGRPITSVSSDQSQSQNLSVSLSSNDRMNLLHLILDCSTSSGFSYRLHLIN